MLGVAASQRHLISLLSFLVMFAVLIMDLVLVFVQWWLSVMDFTLSCQALFQFSLSDILPSLSDISIRSSSDFSSSCFLLSSAGVLLFVEFELPRLSLSSFNCEGDKFARFFVRSVNWPGVESDCWVVSCSWLACCSDVLGWGVALSISSCHWRCFSKFAQLKSSLFQNESDLGLPVTT